MNEDKDAFMQTKCYELCPHARSTETVQLMAKQKLYVVFSLMCNPYK